MITTAFFLSFLVVLLNFSSEAFQPYSSHRNTLILLPHKNNPLQQQLCAEKEQKNGEHKRFFLFELIRQFIDSFPLVLRPAKKMDESKIKNQPPKFIKV